RNLARKQFEKELEVIFSHSNLCGSLVKITGSRFSMDPVFFVGQEIRHGGRFTVVEMEMANRENLISNLRRADFIIKFRDEGSALGAEVKAGISAIYEPAPGGGISFCALELKPEKACHRL